MAGLSTAGWVLHDLGLAAGFGGDLFGQTALEPAVRVLHDEHERGLVVKEAWSGFKWVSAGSLAVMAGTWLVGRIMVSGKSMGRDVRRLTLVKDGLVIGAVATGVATMILGTKLGKENDREGGVPQRADGKVSEHAPRRAKIMQRVIDNLGNVNIALRAGIIGITTVLAMRSGRSMRWSFLSRLLP